MNDGMYDRGADMYIEGYRDGADAVFFVLSDYLSEDIINHIKKKRLEYYALWKGEGEGECGLKTRKQVR